MSAATHSLTLIDRRCGKPAFHMDRVPEPNDPVVAERFEHLDGRPGRSDDPFVCESCGRPLLALFDPDENRWLCDPASYVPREVAP